MNKDEMRKMWEQAAGFMGKPFPRTDDKYTGGPIAPRLPRTDDKYTGGPIAPRPFPPHDEFGRPLPPKPWTPGDEDRRKPKGDKYGGYGGKGPSPRPSKKPNTGPNTPPSMMHDKEAIKGYPSVKPPVNNTGNNIGKSDSFKHDSLKDYKPQNPKP